MQTLLGIIVLVVAASLFSGLHQDIKILIGLAIGTAILTFLACKFLFWVFPSE